MTWRRIWPWGRDLLTAIERDTGTPDAGLPLEGKAAVAGTGRVVQALRGILGVAAVPVAVAGQLRQAAGRLRSTGLVLAYRASAVRALRPRLLGAALTSVVALAGVAQGAPRLRAQLTVRQPVAGHLAAAPRLRAQLTSHVALTGTARAASRLTGGLTVLGGVKTDVAGRLAAAPRLHATGFVLGYRATPIRKAERLTGTLTSTVALAGTVRGGAARAQSNIVPPVYEFLAGRSVATPLRLRATGVVLGYRATPVREVARLRGVLSTPSTGTLLTVVRGGSRLPAALLTTTYPAAEIAGAIPRLRGALIQKRLLQGTIRELNPRLTARIDKTPVLGLTIVGAPRLRAQLTQARPLAATVRTTARVPGAGFRILLAGRTAAAPRALAELGQHQRLAGRLTAAAPRLRAGLQSYVRVPVALAGRTHGGTARLLAALGNTSGTELTATLTALDRYLGTLAVADRYAVVLAASDAEAVLGSVARDRYAVVVVAHDLEAVALATMEEA